MRATIRIILALLYAAIGYVVGRWVYGPFLIWVKHL